MRCKDNKIPARRYLDGNARFGAGVVIQGRSRVAQFTKVGGRKKAVYVKAQGGGFLDKLGVYSHCVPRLTRTEQISHRKWKRCTGRSQSIRYGHERTWDYSVLSTL